MKKVIKGIIKDAYIVGGGIKGMLYILDNGLCDSDSDVGVEVTTSKVLVIQPLTNDSENGPCLVETCHNIYVVTCLATKS